MEKEDSLKFVKQIEAIYKRDEIGYLLGIGDRMVKLKEILEEIEKKVLSDYEPCFNMHGGFAIKKKPNQKVNKNER